MKICLGCGIEQPDENYAFQFKAQGKRFARCRSCKSKDAKARWASGSQKESNYASKAKRVQAAHDYIWELFRQSKCFDCGERNPVVFEFDHIADDKFKDVSQMINSNYGLESIKKEIAKCDIVCANCHKIRTSTRGNHWRHQRINN